MYSGVGPHGFGPGQGAEAVYMAPPEPPRSIYGTLPRGARLRGRPQGPGSDISLPVSSSVAQYATFRRGHEKLGPKVSLKLKKEGLIPLPIPCLTLEGEEGPINVGSW